MFALLVEVLKGVIWDQIALTNDQMGLRELEVAIHEHRQVAQMVAQRNAAEAQRAMREHLLSSFANHMKHQRVRLDLEDESEDG